MTAQLIDQFTGKERDQETGLDYFGARYYGSALGRFTSPDWSGNPEPIPYAKLDDPQSLNLYVYVRNSPVTNRDPDGHICFLGVYGKTCPAAPSPAKPPAPTGQPMALLKTNMANNTTTLITSTPTKPYSETTIETRTAVAKSSLPGAGDPFKTDNIVGVSNRHAGEKAYGPAGAFIDTGDPRGREIHGGGTGLKDPMAAQQGWVVTTGCTRGQNQDVIKLGEAVTAFQKANPGTPIPYVRTAGDGQPQQQTPKGRD